SMPRYETVPPSPRAEAPPSRCRVAITTIRPSSSTSTTATRSLRRRCSGRFSRSYPSTAPTKPSERPTPPATAWPGRSGATASPTPTASPAICERGPCGSTPTTAATSPFPSGDSGPRAPAETEPSAPWTITPHPKRPGSITADPMSETTDEKTKPGSGDAFPAGAPFTIEPGPRLHAGVDARQRLTDEVGDSAGRTILVLTDPGVRAAGVADLVVDVLRPLGRSIEIVEDIPPNPTVDAVDAIAARVRGLDDPVIVAVGGGSVLDAAKAVTIAAPAGLDVRSLAEEPPGSSSVRALPLFAVPTTAGTGSETNGFAVLTDAVRHRK